MTVKNIFQNTAQSAAKVTEETSGGNSFMALRSDSSSPGGDLFWGGPETVAILGAGSTI